MLFFSRLFRSLFLDRACGSSCLCIRCHPPVMELLFPAPLSVSSHPPYHFPPAHDPFHVETSGDRQVQSALQPRPSNSLPSDNSVQRAMNGAASPVAPASQPQTLAPSPLAATPIHSTPTSPKRQPHFFLGCSPGKEDSLSRSRHDSSPSATVLSEPRSRASSKARRHGRPGTSADFQELRSFIPSLSGPRRRALSLDESALPSFRPHDLPDDVPSPYLSFYSSAAPSTEDISDPMPVPAGDPRAESTAMGTTAGHSSGRTSMEHSILVGRRKTWHTLAEVMSTEKGYLNDLRSLVLVSSAGSSAGSRTLTRRSRCISTNCQISSSSPRKTTTPSLATLVTSCNYTETSLRSSFRSMLTCRQLVIQISTTTNRARR